MFPVTVTGLPQLEARVFGALQGTHTPTQLCSRLSSSATSRTVGTSSTFITPKNVSQPLPEASPWTELAFSLLRRTRAQSSGTHSTGTCGRETEPGSCVYGVSYTMEGSLNVKDFILRPSFLFTWPQPNILT